MRGIAQFFQQQLFSAVVAIIGIVFRYGYAQKDSFRHVGEIMLGLILQIFNVCMLDQIECEAVAPE